MSSISPERMAPRMADGAHTYLPPTYHHHHHATADSSHAPLVSLMPQPATPKAAPTAPTAAAADSSSGLMAPLALSSVHISGPGPIVPVGCFSTSHRATINANTTAVPPPSYAATIQHGNANVVGVAAPLHTQQQQQLYGRAAFGASCSASALPISLASSSTEMPSMSLAAGVRAPTAMPSSVSAGGSSSAAAAAGGGAGGVHPHAAAAFFSASGLAGASQPTPLPMPATTTVAKPTASHTPPPYQVLDFARTPGMIFVESAAVLESTQRECGRLAVNAPRPTMVAEQSCKDHTLLLSHNHQRLFVSQLPFGLSLLSVQAVMVAILKVLSSSSDAAAITATPAAGADSSILELMNATRPRSHSSTSGGGSAIGVESMTVRPRAGLDESHFYRWEPSSKPNVGYTGCAFLRASHDAATALLALSKRFMFDCGGVWVATTPAAAAAMADFCEMMKQRPARSRSRDYPWPTPFAAVSIEAQRTHGNAVVQTATVVVPSAPPPVFLASSSSLTALPQHQQQQQLPSTAGGPVVVKQPGTVSTPPALSPPSAGASRIGVPAFPAVVAPATPGHVQLQHAYGGVPSFASSIPAPGLSPVLSAPAAAVMFAVPQQQQQQYSLQPSTPPQPMQPQPLYQSGQLLVDQQQQQQQMLLIQQLQAQIAALQQQQQQQQQQHRVAPAATHAPATGFISLVPPNNTSPGASLTKPPSPPPPVAASSFQPLLQLATFTPSGVEAGNANHHHNQRSQDSPSALPLAFPPVPVQPVQFQLPPFPSAAQPPVVLAMAGGNPSAHHHHHGGVVGLGQTAAAAGLTLLPPGMLVYQLPVLPQQQQPSPNS